MGVNGRVKCHLLMVVVNGRVKCYMLMVVVNGGKGRGKW